MTLKCDHPILRARETTWDGYEEYVEECGGILSSTHGGRGWVCSEGHVGIPMDLYDEWAYSLIESEAEAKAEYDQQFYQFS